MLRRQWDILLVDDEPDVLAVSKLALKHQSFAGIPIKIHECSSKASAIEFLSNPRLSSDVGLAIIDVVMENDQAGLELAQYIRETLKNKSMQIYIRTGQAGKAPEREVIDKYDINGYLTKVEATEGRLYTVLKSSLREYSWTLFLQTILKGMTDLSTSATSAPDLSRAVAQFVSTLGGKTESVDNHCCIFIGDQIVSAGLYNDNAFALQARDRFLKEKLLPLADGSGASHFCLPVKENAEEFEIFIVSPDNSGSPLATPVQCLWRTTFNPVPEAMLTMMAGYLNSVRILWQVVNYPRHFQFAQILERELAGRNS